MQKLNDVLGPEHAATLMAPYFTVDWESLATKDDLEVVRLELRAEIADLRAEMHRGFAVQSRVSVLSLVMAVVAMTSVFLVAG